VPNINLVDCTFLFDAATGSDSSMLNTWTNGGMITVTGGSAWSNHPVTTFLHINPGQNGRIQDLSGNGNHQLKSVLSMADPNIHLSNVFGSALF
jgi:hypothetical protein